MDRSLENIIKDVSVYFNNEQKFNPRWNPNRFQDFLEKHFINWKIENYTDFNYDYCNTYKCFIPCDKTNPIRPCFILYVSYISKVYDYSAGIIRFQNMHFNSLSESNFTEKYGSVTQVLKNYFETQNFIRMKKDWYGLNIPNICTQLCQTPSLERCLFQDRE